MQIDMCSMDMHNRVSLYSRKPRVVWCTIPYFAVSLHRGTSVLF